MTGSPEYRSAMQSFPAAVVFIGTMILGATSSGADVLPLVLGTATPGGGFAVYGQAVADALLETDPTLKITLQATGGSTQNIPLLEAGKLDLGLVEGTTAYEAQEGIGRPPADLRLVAAMYPSPGMFVVRGDSSYRTIPDLRGRRVVFGAANSGHWSLVLPARDARRSRLGLRCSAPGSAALGQRLVQAQATTPENTLAAALRPGMLHPGVARYFREIGLAP